MAIYDCKDCNKKFRVKKTREKGHGYSFLCPHCKTRHWLVKSSFGWMKHSLNNPDEKQIIGESEVYGTGNAPTSDKKVEPQSGFDKKESFDSMEIMEIAFIEKGKIEISNWLDLFPNPNEKNKEWRDRFLVLIISSIDAYCQTISDNTSSVDEVEMFNNIYKHIYPNYGYSSQKANSFYNSLVKGKLYDKYSLSMTNFGMCFMRHLNQDAEGFVLARMSFH